MNDHQAAPLQESVQGQPAEDVSKGSILIVDDTPANLRLLSQMLAESHYKVRAVNSGPRALEAVQANPPDLILLDIMMPGMDGYEVGRRLKADVFTGTIPIIFISALDAVEDKVNAFVVGGVDYITKPFQFEEVLARVETHLMLRRLQKKLEKANLELSRQVQELEAFAHTVAHDLKNPLAVVCGNADLLARYGHTLPAGDVQRIAQATSQGAFKTVDIVNNLLLLASAHKMSVKPQQLDMGSIVNEALSRLSTMLETYRPEIIKPPTWPVALGYAPWVEEVWANYLSNALKYGGRPPRVELGWDKGERAKSEDRNSPLTHHSSSLTFWVRDNGGGLTPQEQAQLFTPFERLGQARIEGHGLGLSIVQRIVEKLDGRVGVESQAGAGSLFYFTLPALPGSPIDPVDPAATLPILAEAASPVVADSLPVMATTAAVGRPVSEAKPQHQMVHSGEQTQADLRVLLVEDSRLAREMALRMLKRLDYQADTAASGPEALLALQQHHYDIVLMDIHMPGMDGLETTRTICQTWPPDQRPCIIAMTANTTSEDRQAGLAAGMNGYINKPIQLDVLKAALEQCISLKSQQAGGRFPAGPMPERSVC